MRVQGPRREVERWRWSGEEEEEEEVLAKTQNERGALTKFLEVENLDGWFLLQGGGFLLRF